MSVSGFRVLAVSLALLLGGRRGIFCLNNGLALTPPMGWLSWTRFGCNVDCTNDPKNCISEQLYKDMADRLVLDGYKDLGYEYVNVDDCWMSNARDSVGILWANSTRFPNGIEALADYVHGLGLKLGMYQDTGNLTCAGYPGSQGYFDLDAEMFAEWGADMIKFDGCYSDPKDMDNIYPTMARALNKTGRPVVFSCNWPFAQMEAKITPNYPFIAQYCNMWRNYYDISDSWSSVRAIMDYYNYLQDILVPVAGPGRWNDPDMLIIGNSGLNLDQSKVQMAMWSIYAAPLLMSNDLRNITDDFKAVLQNRRIIDINQDPLGLMGKLLFTKNSIQYYSRPVIPVVRGKPSFAVAVVNLRETGGPVTVKTSLSSLNLTNTNGYSVLDLYTGQSLGILRPKDNLEVSVNPTGVVMVKAEVRR